MKNLIKKIIKEEFWDEPEFNLEENNYFLYFDPPIPSQHFNTFLENLHSKGIALDWDYGRLRNRNDIETMYFYGDNYEYYDWDDESEERVLKRAKKGKVAIFDISLRELKNWPFTPYDDNTKAPNFDGYEVLGLNFGGNLTEQQLFSNEGDVLSFKNINTLQEFVRKLDTYLSSSINVGKSGKYLKSFHETIKHLKELDEVVKSSENFNENFSNFINLFYRPHLKTERGRISFIIQLINSGTEMANLLVTINNIIEIMSKKNFSDMEKLRHLKVVKNIILKNKNEDSLPDILNYFDNLGIRPSEAYEKSFINRGFKSRQTQPRISRNTGNIRKYTEHNEGIAQEICDLIYNDIGNYIEIENGDKHDIVYKGKDIYYSDKSLICHNDLIEVKYLPYSSDSYLSEFMAIGKDSRISKLFKTMDGENALARYNEIITCLYNRINNNKDLSKDIITHLMGNVKGIFFQDYVYVPKENIKFYITDKGMSNKQKRLTVRFRVIDNGQIYKFVEDENEEFKVKEATLRGTNETDLNHIGEEPNYFFLGSEI
jgi:hypothetical protein